VDTVVTSLVSSRHARDHSAYIATAKQWTFDYANPNKKDEKVERLAEMGFDREAIKAALTACGDDENLAMERLLV
jgi:Holliday junction resolvasome RuvABC DNA-binding subunit